MSHPFPPNFSHLRPEIVREIKFSAVRSRGPGGQNVNKVSSAALMIWDFSNSNYFSAPQKNLLRARLHSVLNRDGHVQLRSDEFRDLERNKQRCIDKLLELIERALHKPKKRIATKPTRASRERRQDSKRKRGETKALRKRLM